MANRRTTSEGRPLGWFGHFVKLNFHQAAQSEVHHVPIAFFFLSRKIELYVVKKKKKKVHFFLKASPYLGHSVMNLCSPKGNWKPSASAEIQRASRYLSFILETYNVFFITLRLVSALMQITCFKSGKFPQELVIIRTGVESLRLD